MRYGVVPLVVLGLIPGIPATAADAPAAPVAIVMSLSGSTEPPLSAMSEIPPDRPVRLAPGAQLTFLHYARCKLVTVAGGSLTMNQTSYHSDGHIVSEADGPCPVVAEIDDPTHAGTTGGLVMRGIQAAPRWPTNLDIVLAGPHADDVRAATIYSDARPPAPILRLNLAGRRLSEPSDAPALPANRQYTLRLVVAGRPQPIKLPFFAREATGAASLLVLRIE